MILSTSLQMKRKSQNIHLHKLEEPYHNKEQLHHNLPNSYTLKLDY